MAVAEVLANKAANEATNSTPSKNRWLLEHLAAPLASRPIADMTAAEILDLPKQIDTSGRRETARRVRGLIGSTYRYAIVTLRDHRSDACDPRGVVAAQRFNTAVITDEKKLGGLIDEYDG